MDLLTKKIELASVSQVQKIFGSPSIVLGEFTIDMGFWLGVEGCSRKESNFTMELLFYDFKIPREFLGPSGHVFHLGHVGTQVSKYFFLVIL